MTWYGENRSGRTDHWNVGDLVRYDDGPTALMRVTYVREMGEDCRGIACSVRYYGRGFHDRILHDDNGVECAHMGRYHGQCQEPTQVDKTAWAKAHDASDDWNGMRSVS